MQIKIVLILWEQAILRKADAEPTLFWRINCNKGWHGKRKSTAQDAAGSPTQIRANALPRSGYYCIFILQRNWFFKRKGEWTLLTACKHFSWIFLYPYPCLPAQMAWCLGELFFDSTIWSFLRLDGLCKQSFSPTWPSAVRLSPPHPVLLTRGLEPPRLVGRKGVFQVNK